MNTPFPLSIDEEASMDELGGFDLVIASVDRILSEHGVDGRLFSEQERAVIRRGRRRQLVWKQVAQLGHRCGI